MNTSSYFEVIKNQFHAHYPLDIRTIDKRNILHIAGILILTVLLLVLPDIFETPYAHEAIRVRGRVISADNSRVHQYGIVKEGTQDMQVEILEGQFKGREVNAVNLLTGKMEIDKYFTSGDSVFLVLNAEGDQILEANASDYFRLDTEAVVFALFAVLLIAYAGWTGIKALLSFVFAIAVIWKILVPGILLGWDPVLISLLLITIITTVTLSLVTGLSRVSLVAILGSLAGIGLTCLLSFVLYPPFHLSGAVMSFAESLLYSGFPELNIDHLLLASVFIGASGAVMDLAIDISTAMNEVHQKSPSIHTEELIRSGLSVGRAMVGTLVTTLLMAYTAGYLALLMVFMGKGIPPANILNTNYVTAEILKTLVGSLGLIAVAPFTAVVGGWIFSRPQNT
jgi:uncharacterized membrane protein